jgi:hypothetical protein
MTGVFGFIGSERTIAIHDRGSRDVMTERTRVGWPDVWAVIGASAVKRLGKPLLRAYLSMTILAVRMVTP